MVSGPRPVMPPSAKMASMVSGFRAGLLGAPDWAAQKGISSQQIMS
jgi:hypothetical protein